MGRPLQPQMAPPQAIHGDAEVNNPRSAENLTDAKKRVSHAPLKVAKSFNIKVRLNLKVIINLQIRWTKTGLSLNLTQQNNKPHKTGHKSRRLIARFQANNGFQLQAQLLLICMLRTLIAGFLLEHAKLSL
jgi:hypothetical protein